MAQLLLGPLLRYVDETSAVVWVETDAPCEVEVLDHRAATFHVEGHHYALVIVEGLRPATVEEYEVALDGTVAWPRAGDDRPPPAIRTLDPDGPTRIAFGSCRAAAPHEPPWTDDKGRDGRGLENDALVAYAGRLDGVTDASWPDLLLMLGDQVYADAASPSTREFIRSRRSTDEPPGEEVADFEEYCHLYREAWSDPEIRWLLSSMPTAMIFDDHDIIDDWNISASWLRDAREQPWWHERIVSGLMSYWLYQHIGNLAPDDVRTDPLFAAVTAAEDGGPALREFAHAADRDSATARWSYARDLGRSRLVVVDSRAGRVLDGDERDMLDEAEWHWLDGVLTGDVDHLLVASSLPVLLAPGIHDVEGWNEALCAGVWGRLGVRAGESIRRAVDLEHWGAFRRSFERLVGMLREVAAGRRGDPPASIVLLSGDVHHAYLATAALHRDDAAVSPLYQAVASPMRQSVEPAVERVYRFVLDRGGDRIGRFLAKLAGVDAPSIRWRISDGPWFDNQVSTLTIDGRAADLRIDAVGAGEDAEMRTVLDRSLSRRRSQGS